jgi:hypothetical protein
METEKRLYRVEFDGQGYFMNASSMSEAVEKWRLHTAEEGDPENIEPDSVSMLCDSSEWIDYAPNTRIRPRPRLKTAREITLENLLATEIEMRVAAEINLRHLVDFSRNPTDDNWQSLTFSGIAVEIRDWIYRMASKPK